MLGMLLKVFHRHFLPCQTALPCRWESGVGLLGDGKQPLFYLCKAILKIASSKIRLKPPVLICRLLLGLLKPKDSNLASQMTSNHFWKAYWFISPHCPPAHKDPLSPLTIFTELQRTHAFISLTFSFNCNLCMQMFRVFLLWYACALKCRLKNYIALVPVHSIFNDGCLAELQGKFRSFVLEW